MRYKERFKLTGMKYQLVCCLAVLLAPAICAQPLDEVPRYMHLEVAEEHMAIHDYYRALEHYEEAYKLEREDELAYKIAMLHYQLRDYNRAERWLKRVIARDETGRWPDAVFAYAVTLKKDGQYEEAIEAFNVYANMVTDEALLARADLEVEGLMMAAKSEAPLELVIENMGRKINSRYSEFSPVMHPDGSFYMAALPSSELVVLDGTAENPYARIFQAEKDRNGNWDRPKALPKKLNREGFHTGNVTFSKDGQRMYFTRAITNGDLLAESRIYESAYGRSGWGAPNELPNVNGDYIATHPNVGTLLGNEVLFFSSDMDGGEGGFDIYYSIRRGEGDYSLPVNLGPGINTQGDETTPYFRDNVLYFSTDGRAGFGGLDIFSVEWDGTNWSDPENLGAGYNTGYDDWYFSANTEGTRGFLVSNRPADETRSIKSKTCCDDIFTFEIRDIVIDLLTNVYDKQENPLEGARVTKFEVVNNRPGAADVKVNEDGNRFNFLLDPDKSYKVTVEREGYFPQEFQFNTVGIVEEHTFKMDVYLERAPSAESETRVITINEPIRLNNIYYDFDDDQILPEAEKDLNTLLDLMDTYPDMVIELSSHTDSRGNDRYNERLSQRRAQSAVDWLIDRGIDPDRLQAVGYGERRILNKCTNGVPCTEEEHRFNRRTEFKIIAGPTSIEVKREVLPEEEKKN